ncbi:hypothetical protein GKE82_03730 [Conexibacter sp. W3-3-2]|uniref:hypothetical protein n=1 Tax=Conexibacter sp. W3-3-2 TaxID=2675227 RepID=UPI0012B90F48|nr:hypothetical protein [Conexibacter sp. W3-3-2]MTD43435.1 hypothetical protein [Conexibacter sp. W3-3-2]
MEYLFLFAIVTPLALLVLNLTGFRAGSTPATAVTLDLSVAPTAAPTPVAATPAVRMPSPAIVVPEQLDLDAEIYLLPRRDVVTAPTGSSATTGGTLVALPRHTPLVAQRSMAQR